MHSPVSDTYEFNQAATRLLDKIEQAVEPMKAYNEVFYTKRSDGEIGEMFTIDLGPKVGIYQMEVSLEECVFEYSSPISGKLLYCLSSATGEWVNTDDGHQFEGILVRDLLRSNCIGLPKL
jgi:frataxin-like iron-binding protein CyaY